MDGLVVSIVGVWGEAVGRTQIVCENGLVGWGGVYRKGKWQG